MDIFIHQNTGAELEDFSEKLFSLFDITIREEGESSNYPPHQRYFVGYGKLKNLKLWDDDSETVKDFPFVLSVRGNTHKFGNIALPNQIEQIAEILRVGGIKCFIPTEENYWNKGWNKEGNNDWNKEGNKS